MNRRDLFRTFLVAGAAAVATRCSGQQAKVEAADATVGLYPHWPFDEIRIPYRERAEKIKWPNNGPLCLTVHVSAEWAYNRQSNNLKAKYKRDLLAESENDLYTFTVGIWRAVELLDKFGIKANIFPNAGMVERYPDLFRELHSKGHEITTRAYDQSVPTTEFTPEEERQEIRRCTATLEKAIGQRPVGWINPGATCTDKTPEILADEGYIWTGDLRGDELPYGIRTSNGKKIVVIPHQALTDFYIFPRSITGHLRSGGQEAFQYVKDIFDEMYKLGKKEYPKLLIYGIHPYQSCKPERISLNERALEYFLKSKDIWSARYVDIAEYWMKNYMKAA